MASAGVRIYWDKLVQKGCIVHGGCLAEIAHCHGGSIVERLKEPKAKGKKLERMNWLVLPLCPAIHRLDLDSLDQYPRAWERRYGTQASYIDKLEKEFNLPLWQLAQRGRK